MIAEIGSGGGMLASPVEGGASPLSPGSPSAAAGAAGGASFGMADLVAELQMLHATVAAQATHISEQQRSLEQAV